MGALTVSRRAVVWIVESCFTLLVLLFILTNVYWWQKNSTTCSSRQETRADVVPLYNALIDNMPQDQQPYWRNYVTVHFPPLEC